MRLLFLGDVVGRSGREAVIRELPALRERFAPDLVVLNGENAAGGFGITEAIYEMLIGAGVDVITLGNHAFDQREALVFIERVDNLLRPVNYPSGTPGRGSGIFTARNGGRVLVVNVMGVAKMEALADPFGAVDHELESCPLKTGCDASLIDFHAELTSEKMGLGHYVADHQILAGGTAYVTDAGMCGDYDSVIGMDKEEPLNRFLRKIPLGRFTPATGPATVSGIAVLTDDATGLALKIAPVRIGGRLEPAWPEW
jgi:metallophosphoesterase (TIGR00282 family)